MSKEKPRREDRIEHIRLYNDDAMSIYDFSEGGVGVFLDRACADGSPFTLRIGVGDLKISLKGNVVHASVFGKQYRTGFKFSDVREDDKSLLHEMVNRYSRGVPVKIQLHAD